MCPYHDIKLPILWYKISANTYTVHSNTAGLKSTVNTLISLGSDVIWHCWNVLMHTSHCSFQLKRTRGSKTPITLLFLLTQIIILEADYQLTRMYCPVVPCKILCYELKALLAWYCMNHNQPRVWLFRCSELAQYRTCYIIVLVMWSRVT